MSLLSAPWTAERAQCRRGEHARAAARARCADCAVARRRNGRDNSGTGKARNLCAPAPIRAAVRDGFASGAAARRRFSKADGAAPPPARGAGRGGARPGDGCAGRGARESPPSHSAGPGHAGAGLDHARWSCAQALAAQRTAGSGKAGRMAGAAEECERGTGDAGPGPAVGLPGAEHGVSQPRRTSLRSCRGFSSTPSARCPCAWRRARFSTWASRTASIRRWRWLSERMTGLRVESGSGARALSSGPRTRRLWRRAFPPVGADRSGHGAGFGCWR